MPLIIYPDKPFKVVDCNLLDGRASVIWYRDLKGDIRTYEKQFSSMEIPSKTCVTVSKGDQLDQSIEQSLQQYEQNCQMWHNRCNQSSESKHYEEINVLTGSHKGIYHLNIPVTLWQDAEYNPDCDMCSTALANVKQSFKSLDNTFFHNFQDAVKFEQDTQELVVKFGMDSFTIPAQAMQSFVKRIPNDVEKSSIGIVKWWVQNMTQTLKMAHVESIHSNGTSFILKGESYEQV